MFGLRHTYNLALFIGHGELEETVRLRYRLADLEAAHFMEMTVPVYTITED
jgi:hypothetical protein